MIETETHTQTITLTDAGGTIHAPNWAAIASLHKHLAATMGAVAAVHKDGQHGTGFAYTSWDEAAAAISAALAANGLAFTATILEAHQAGNVAMVDMAMTLCDADTGAMKVIRWQAAGISISAATTSCVKHALSKTLLISAEHDDNPPPATDRRPTTQRTTQPQPRPAAATPAPAAPAAAHPTPPPPATHIDATTGEITDPDTAAIPTTITPLPLATDKVGVKWQWMIAESKRQGWNAAKLTSWLQEHYHVAQPAALNGQTDAACLALFTDLRAAEIADATPAHSEPPY